MNIIELAKQAGIEDAHFHAPHPGVIAQLERFAALVEAAARADEREACAKVCDELHRDWKWRASESIRARGTT